MLNLGGPTPAPHTAPGPVGPQAPVDPLFAHESIGAALRAIRLERGLELVQVAEVTRVRRAYLEALEDMRLDVLPSRPFTMGYLRAYASALGVDPEVAIERFKSDDPVLDEPLRAPVGVVDERDPRVAIFVVGALIIIAAIVLWNIAQRAMMAAAPPPALAPEATAEKLLDQLKTGPVSLGEPLPAPVESTTPPLYETPGLAASLGLDGAPPGESPTPLRVGEPPPVDLASLKPVFTPQGRVYGSGDGRVGSVVTVQALKGGALIVRGADGSVYFARQLAKGEAYRVPQIASLTLDVSSPQDFQVFVNGQSRGVLPSTQVLASKLATAAEQPTARPASARPPTPAPASVVPAPATAPQP